MSCNRRGLAWGEVSVLKDIRIQWRDASLPERRHDELWCHCLVSDRHELIHKLALGNIGASKVNNLIAPVEPGRFGGTEASDIKGLSLVSGVRWELEYMDVVFERNPHELVRVVRAVPVEYKEDRLVCIRLLGSDLLDERFEQPLAR
jgi:hypothetical protein